MNARTEPSQLLPLRLTSPYARTTVVAPWGFPMDVEFEYTEPEAPIIGDLEFSHPGSPPNAALLSCKVGGVDIMEMLSLELQERIEDAICDQME